MRFLLDEMFSHRAAQSLAAQGIEAAHVRELGLAATDDNLVLDFACDSGSVLVTGNLRDFRPLHAERIARGATVAPLLLVTQERLNEFGSSQAESVAKLVSHWAKANPRPYAGEHWLGPHSP